MTNYIVVVLCGVLIVFVFIPDQFLIMKYNIFINKFLYLEWCKSFIICFGLEIDLLQTILPEVRSCLKM
jgi:hypothetical protein